MEDLPIEVVVASEIRDRIMAMQDSKSTASWDDFCDGLEAAMEIIDNFIDEVNSSGS